jgi:hypothetical protein
MGSFKKATRKKLKGRVAIDGPSGGGKTLTGLRFAFTLGQRVAVIDTEHRSASKYCGMTYDGAKFEFDTCELTDFSPTRFTELITQAGHCGDYDVVFVDSLTHAWIGEGGALDLKDQKGGNFQAWASITPMQRKMVDAIINSPIHVIVTMRSKTEYVVSTEAGRTSVTRLGLAPIQRSEMEYEFDLYGSMDITNTITVTKTRCPELSRAVSVKPGREFLLPFKNWLEEGSERVMILPETREQLRQLKQDLKINDVPFSNGLYERYRVKVVDDLSQEDAVDLVTRLEAKKAPKVDLQPVPEAAVA